MCILFIHTCDPTSKNSKYKLILASNRDEFYERPAASAHEWTEAPNVIGGRDMEPGREGGTWLAACPSSGKIATLLNLPGVPTPVDALGRGSVVADYLANDCTAEEYAEEFSSRDKKYGPFTLVTVEIGSKNNCKVRLYSNYDKKQRSYDSNVMAFGNSLPECPLKKTFAGKERFEKIVTEHNSNGAGEEVLLDELLTLLKWENPHLPDDELERRRPNAPKELAAVFVNVPKIKYGTRTHTIILVDNEGNMDFFEWTKVPEQNEWQRTHIRRSVPI